MISLSNATSWTKDFIKWAGISLVALLLILTLFRVGVYIKNMITPPAPPTVSFGKLPKIILPEGISTQPLSYSVDTVTGSLPSFSDRANVYKIEVPSPNLLALDTASKKVAAVGFSGQWTKLSDELYQWSANDSSSGLSSKIVFNIFSQNFNLSSLFLTNPQVLQGNNLPNETAAKDAANNFLSNFSSMPSDLDLGKTTTTLLSISASTLIPTTSLSNTQIIRVDFFQKDLNNIPVVYPQVKSSIINIYVGGGNYTPQIVQADFFHQSISSSSATYPIITAQEALTRLKNGNAYIASYDGASQSIVIKNVYLGYYMGSEKQDFTTPVVVFEGSNGFTAYVPAVTDAWIQK